MEKVRLELGATSPTQCFHMRDLTRRNQARFGRMDKKFRARNLGGWSGSAGVYCSLQLAASFAQGFQP